MFGLFYLQRSFVFLEEVFEFVVGDHLVVQLKYGPPVLFFGLLDKPRLFDCCFRLGRPKGPGKSKLDILNLRYKHF